jgi:hypothetical protein
MLSVTVLDLLKQARQANGSMGDGVTMSAEEADTDMLALNIMLAEWSASGYGVYFDKQETFALTVNKASYTWGTGGNFNSSRPTEIRDQCFIRLNDIDYPVSLIGADDYAQISTKSTTSLPDSIYFDPTYPLATVFLYPSPDQAYALYITAAKTIDTFTSIYETIVLPQEYASAIKWNLAMELMPSYNIPLSPIVGARAKRSLTVVKNLNADLRLEPVKAPSIGGQSNVYLRNIDEGY